MTIEELIDLIADLPDKALPCPVLVPIPGHGWQTVESVKFDEDRVIFVPEPF